MNNEAIAIMVVRVWVYIWYQMRICVQIYIWTNITKWPIRRQSYIFISHQFHLSHTMRTCGPVFICIYYGSWLLIIMTNSWNLRRDIPWNSYIWSGIRRYWSLINNFWRIIDRNLPFELLIGDWRDWPFPVFFA